MAFLEGHSDTPEGRLPAAADSQIPVFSGLSGRMRARGPSPGARRGVRWAPSDGAGLIEGTEDVEAVEVGDGGSEQGLEPGPGPSPVAGLAHAEVLEVIDLALDLGPAAQQGLGPRLVLSGPGPGDAVPLVTRCLRITRVSRREP